MVSTLLVQAIVSGLALGGIYALVAVSFSITFTTTKTLNFAQGNFVAIGSFVAASTLVMISGASGLRSLGQSASQGFNYPIATLVAGVVLAIIGVILFVTDRPPVRRQGPACRG